MKNIRNTLLKCGYVEFPTEIILEKLPDFKLTSDMYMFMNRGDIQKVNGWRNRRLKIVSIHGIYSIFIPSHLIPKELTQNKVKKII